MQTNMTWGKGSAGKMNVQGVVQTANLLRNHFSKKRYKEDGLIANGKLYDNSTLVFRRKDTKDRTVFVQLNIGQIQKVEILEKI